MSDLIDWSVRLEDDGFLERSGDGILHTTKRWHAALARAALQLYQDGHDLFDMRTPIAAVLVDHYADEDASSLADGIRAMYMVAMTELIKLSPAPPPR